MIQVAQVVTMIHLAVKENFYFSSQLCDMNTIVNGVNFVHRRWSLIELVVLSSQNNFQSQNNVQSQNNFLSQKRFKSQNHFLLQNIFLSQINFPAHNNFLSMNIFQLQNHFQSQNNFPSPIFRTRRFSLKSRRRNQRFLLWEKWIPLFWGQKNLSSKRRKRE